VHAERGDLRFFLSLSLAFHVAVLLVFQLTGIGRDGGGRGNGGAGRQAIEVSFSTSPPSSSSATSDEGATQPIPRAHRRGGSVGARLTVRGVRPGAADGVPLPDGDSHAPLMCMRDCKPQSPSLAPPGLGEGPGGDGDAQAEQPLPGSQVLRQRESDGIKVVRYTDGGRLFSSGSGPPVEGGPHLGRLGLMELADGPVGGRTGHDACNPYRRAVTGPRTLVLLVDTSGSVGGESTACAAAAALAALDQGFFVEVANFSTRTLHQPPTRDADAIYETLSTIQRKKTYLPGVGRFMSSSARPRDFVLITDTAVGNYEQVLPEYQKALRLRPDNRGILYLIGKGVVCEKCQGPDDQTERCTCNETSRRPLEAMQKAGFELEVTEMASLPP
jgi:hypothetical protein